MSIFTQEAARHSKPATEPQGKRPGHLEAYVFGRGLAKDICFAMARAYGCHDVMVTEVKGYGWHIDCITDPGVGIENVEVFLRKDQKGKVNWL